MIGKNIKQLRKARGLTQKELADKLGVTQSAVGNWEAGIRNPRASDLLNIAEALEVPVGTVVLGEDE